jgi:hypothetical protein
VPIDEELDHLKRVANLTELAASLGYQLAPRQTARAASVSMRHPGTDDKIIIRRDIDGHWTYFSVRDDRDGGSVIDFLQRRRSLSLGAVRRELRAWLREERPRSAVDRYRPTVETRPRYLAAVAATYGAATPGESRYLRSRGISAETLRSPRFAHSFRVDRRGNVLFPHCDPADRACVVGYEVKNRGFTSFAAGGRKTYWTSALREDDVRLVIVEGPIDALSYHQLFPNARTRYLSTAGAIGSAQLRLIGQAIAAMPRGSEIVVATDSDPAGERLHERLASVRDSAQMRRHASPVPKDWNDYLRSLDRKRPMRQERGFER